MNVNSYGIQMLTNAASRYKFVGESCLLHMSITSDTIAPTLTPSSTTGLLKSRIKYNA